MRKAIATLAGLIAAGAVIAFAVTLYRNNIEQNIASWALWFCLDAIILRSMLKEKSKDWHLLACYTFAAGAVTLMVLTKGAWKWGVVETLASIGAGVAMLAYLKVTPRWAIGVAAASMMIASVPVIVDAWVKPDPSSLWMWSTASVCSAVALTTIKEWKFVNWAFPITSLLIQVTLTALLI